MTKSHMPESPASSGEPGRWPVKIKTLGSFAIEVNGQPVEFSKKAPRGPLTLLKALIAFGGQEVSKLALCDALWPDADSDAAYQAWATTLHRLRELLGNQEVIQRRDGKLTLNPQLCWVDSVAFEAGLASIPRTDGKMLSPSIHRQRHQALLLYKGSFLKDEEGFWIQQYRERLQSHYLRQVGYLVREWESLGQYNDAIGFLEEALQREPLAEPLYQYLMKVLLHTGRYVEAKVAYDQCRSQLMTAFRADPSPETKRLLAEI